MLGVVLESHSEQAVRRDQIARWGRSVADLATAAAHFALQVRLGARDGELFEPTGVSRYVGSSSMAFKQNPTRSERICGLERVTRALAGALDANVVWWDQRDLSASSVERVVVPQLVGLTAYCLVEATNVARGLTVDARVCEANLARIPESPAELWRRVADGMSHEAAYEVGRGAGRGPGPTGAPEATKEASVADEEGSS
jgi:adenylosuccinate lyase